MSVDHYENFPVASLLLPPNLRKPVEAIYRFARGADDIADEGDATPAERLRGLAAYAGELNRIERGEAPSPAFAPLARTIAEWRLPIQLFRDLLDAFAQDVGKTRYCDFAELKDYCRRSADPVGRLLLCLYAAETPENLRRSDAICTSLQLINFCQDVAIDWQKQRIYLPQDDMLRFGVSADDIAAGRCDERWRALMGFELGRARAMMVDGAPLARALPGRIGWELRLIVLGGLRIIEAIETANYDVFRHRPVLGKHDWLRLGWRALNYRKIA